MALSALAPGFFSSGRLGGGLPTLLHNKGYEKLILFKHANMMTLLANNIPVFSLLPLLIRLLHEVAGNAEIRIFLPIFVISISYNNSQSSNYKKSCENKAFDMINKARNLILPLHSGIRTE
jgi:hypothetical protein